MVFLSWAILGAKYCFGNYACYQAENTTNALEITLTSKVNGWIGFGVSNASYGMVADIIMAWKSASDGVIVSTRVASMHARPAYIPNENLTVLNTTITNDGFSISFSRPLIRSLGFKYNVGKDFLVAYSNTTLISNQPSYPAARHTGRFHWVNDLNLNKSQAVSIVSTATPIIQPQESHCAQLSVALWVTILLFQ